MSRASTTTPVWASAGHPAGALQLRVRLTPKSSRDAVLGLVQTTEGPAIKATVRAVPHEGAANKAVVALFANWLRMPKSSITLSAGTKSRTKLLTIMTDEPDQARIIDQVDRLSTK